MEFNLLAILVAALSSFVVGFIWYNPKDTIFKNTFYDLNKLEYYNFIPDSVSPARNIGNPDVAKLYPVDLNGNSRLTDNMPDAGAYEWIPTKKSR